MSISCLIEGINQPHNDTITSPAKAFINNAFATPMFSDTIPIINAPIGPAPIAIVTVPKALPLYSVSDTSSTIADCMVPNPAVPQPRNNKVKTENIYEPEIENNSNEIKDKMEP